MACFIIPAVEAVATTIVAKAVEKHESRTAASEKNGIIPLSQKLKVLNGMLWGGSGLLAFEHVWHGELTPWFPFLTNAANPGNTAKILYEMATAGTAMALIVTAVWGLAMIAFEQIRKKEAVPANETETAV